MVVPIPTLFVAVTIIDAAPVPDCNNNLPELLKIISSIILFVEYVPAALALPNKEFVPLHTIPAFVAFNPKFPFTRVEPFTSNLYPETGWVFPIPTFPS